MRVELLLVGARTVVRETLVLDAAIRLHIEGSLEETPLRSRAGGL